MKKGTTARSGGCRPDGTRSPSRCRASCCNAKLKQNYLVPLPSTVHGMGAESLGGGEGDCRRPGAVASYQGCILTRVKNGCLRPYSAPRRNPGMGVYLCALCVQICANLERGCFVCRRTAEGQEFIDLRPGLMHIDLCNSEITRSLSREGGKVH